MHALGFRAEPIAPALEARKIDDWKAASPPEALIAALNTFVDRAPAEIAEVKSAIETVRPDLLLIDVHSWGAAALAEVSGIPWASYAPYFLPFEGAGIPAWGFGLPPAVGEAVAMRDAILWQMMHQLFDQVLPAQNAVRESVGARPFQRGSDYIRASSLLLYYTAEPFEYRRDPWPEHVRLVGPGIWEPASENGDASAKDGPPLVLVTASTEFQNDGRLIRTAIEALRDQPYRVVLTTGALDPTDFEAAANMRIVRYAPHGELLGRAVCVVCHGGMGITQKALAAGVPVCVVPFGRDQFEVGRHVATAGAGVSLPAFMLETEALRVGVRETIACRPGARRIADAFARAGGAVAAADELEQLSPATLASGS
jgi:MGT family glycosyltransferase